MKNIKCLTLILLLTSMFMSCDEEKFLEEAVENEYILFFEHDLYNECCTLKRTNQRITIRRFVKLSEIL